MDEVSGGENTVFVSLGEKFCDFNWLQWDVHVMDEPSGITQLTVVE